MSLTVSELVEGEFGLQLSRSAHDMVFVDHRVPDFERIAAEITNSSPGTIVLQLSGDADGVEQIADALAGYSSLGAIHIVSHGSSGSLSLGNSVLSADNIEGYTDLLGQIGLSLELNGDILLYGCDVGAGEAGAAFLERLSSATSADVAASSDLTGAAASGGDWDLEIQQGDVEAESLQLLSVHETLADGQYIVGDGSGGGANGNKKSNGNGGGSNDTLTGTDESDVIVGDGSGGGGGGGGGVNIRVGAAGGSGNDQISGGAGNDILFGDGFDGDDGGSAGNNPKVGGDGGLFGGGGGGAYSGFAGGSATYGGGAGSGSTGANSTTDDDGHFATGGANSGPLGGGGGGFGSGGNGGSGYGSSGDSAVHFLTDTSNTIYNAVSAILSNLLTNNPDFGSGADTLDGGAGSDDLFGLGGEDVFLFELNDATSGSDVDTVWDFRKNGETTETLDLEIGSSLISSAKRDALIAAQTTVNTNDRQIVFNNGGSEQVTILVKDISRDLTASDFSVNSPPTVSGAPTDITVIEDTLSNVDLSAMSFADVDGDNLTVTLVLSAESFSTLADGAGNSVTETQIDGQNITLEGTAANITTYLDTPANIQYTGATNANGQDQATITVSATDGNGGSLESDPVINIDITAASDDPDGTDKTIRLRTTATHTFAASDFGFTDPDTGDALNSVQVNVQTLDNGALELSSVAVTDGDSISLANIGNLVYTPSATGSDSFTFTVEDDSDNSTDPTPNTITFTVIPPPEPPTPPPEPEPEPEVVTETIDGVTTETVVTTNDDGTTTQTTTIEPVTSTREEDGGTGNAELADIPLQFSDSDRGTAQTTVSLPVGVGLVSEGDPVPKTAETAQNALISLTESALADIDGDNQDTLAGAQAFLDETIETGNEIVVNSIVFTVAEGVTEVPQTIVIQGSPTEANGGVKEALIIDASNLPPGTQLNLENVEFAVIIGPATLRGGAGANIVYAGAGSQDILLGEDDDELYGGDGDDIIGSEGGDDQLFGNAGNDTLFGGEGADFIHGGADTDTISYTGNQADYTLEQHHSVITLTSIADPSDIDTIVNAEVIQFADGNLSLNYDSKLDKIATLYQQMFSRQADLDGFQYWAERSENSDSLQAIAVDFLWSEEAQLTFDIVVEDADDESAIEYLYQALMGREFDQTGKDYWLDRYQSGDSLQEIAEDFMFSEEFAGYIIEHSEWEFLV